MKKFISCFFACLFGIICFIPVFSMQTFASTKAEATTEPYAESITQNKQQVVSTNQENLLGLLFECSTPNNNPFDREKGEMMPGTSITPKTDEYGQINSNFSVQSFEVTANSSLFMWIFFPDEKVYSLTVEIKGTNLGYAKWSFSSAELTQMFLSTASFKGWKLFEFCIADSQELKYDNVQFNSLCLTYKDELGLNPEKPKHTLSFYDVYVSDSVSENTKIAKSNSYSYYQFANNFNSEKSIYIGDKFDYNSVLDLFEYIYIAKFDIKKSKSNEYTFSAKITTPTSLESDLLNLNSFTYLQKGAYTIEVVISEQRNTVQETVMRATKTVYVDEFLFGAFSSLNLQIYEGEVKTILFNISDEFVLVGDIVFESLDKNVATITYYVTHNTCQIEVLGKKRGQVKIRAKASGYRFGTDKTQEYSNEITVSIGKKDSNKGRITILWISLSVYLIVGVVYAIISIVQAKKSSVR